MSTQLPGGGAFLYGGKPAFLKGKGGVLQQHLPLPWRAGFDAQMLDDLGNPVRLPDKLPDLIQATFQPAQAAPEAALQQAMRPAIPRLAQLRQAEEALGTPGILERALGALGLF